MKVIVIMAGGTGEVFRWREAAEEIRKLNKPLLLAGGISAENAEEAGKRPGSGGT